MDPMTAASFGKMIGGRMGGIGSGIASFFNDNPFDAGADYYNQLPGMFEKEYRPWINKGFDAADFYNKQGQMAGGSLWDQIGQLTNDPTGKLAGWGAQYQASPGYQWQLDQAMQGANRAYAAGGMAGSPAHQQAAATAAQGLANQDYYNWLGHVQNLYGLGMNNLNSMYGVGANTAGMQYQVGANMANNLANNMGAAYMNQGNMANASANWENQNLMGGIGSLFGA